MKDIFDRMNWLAIAQNNWLWWIKRFDDSLLTWQSVWRHVKKDERGELYYDLSRKET